MKSLVAIEPEKITSNCYKNLKPIMINFWDMESRARRNNNLDPVQHIGEKFRVVESIGLAKLCQTTLAKTQLKDKHCNDCSRAFVGRIFQTIFQMKSLRLSFNFNFQMSFHKVVEIGDAVAEK